MFETKLARSLVRVALFASAAALALPCAASSWVRMLAPAGKGTGIAVVPHGAGSLVAYTGEGLFLVELDGAGKVRSAKRCFYGASTLLSAAGMPDGGAVVTIAAPMRYHHGTKGEFTTSILGGWQRLSGDLEDIGSNLLTAMPDIAPEDRGADTRVRGFCGSPDGDVFAVADFGPERSMVISIDPDRRRPWSRTLDWQGEQLLQAVAPDGDGVIVAGTAAGHAVVARLDVSGNVTWQRAVVRGQFNAITATPDGSWLVAGGFPGVGQDILVTKLARDGKPIWLRAFGSTADEHALSVHLTKRGSILVGAAQTSTKGTSVLALELGTDGSLLRDLSLASSGPGEAIATARADGAGELILAIQSPQRVVVARYDGNDPRVDCATSANLVASNVSASSAELPLVTSAAPFAAFPGLVTAGPLRLIEVTSEAATCKPPVPAAAEPPLDGATMQLIEITAFKHEVRALLEKSLFDELESLAAQFRASRTTFANGDFKIREFYMAMAPYCVDDCAQLMSLLESWKQAKPDSPTPRITLAEAHIAARDAGDSAADRSARAAAEVRAVAPDFADPELQRLRLHMTEGDPWQVFEQATSAHPDYYYLYTNAARETSGDRAALDRIVKRGVSLTHASMGEGMLARISSVAQLSGGDVTWVALQWPRVQAAYHDLLKAYPASYKNMTRFGMLACELRDRRVAASVMTHMGEAVTAATELTEISDAAWNSCEKFATGSRFEPWVDGPQLTFGKTTSAKGADFEIPDETDEATYRLLATIRSWVASDRSGWPRIVFNRQQAESAGLSGAEVGFFAESGGRTQYVTASPTGFDSIVTVSARQRDGSSVPIQPERSADPGITHSARFRWNAEGVKVLVSTPEVPQFGDRVHIVFPRSEEQVVVTGAVRTVVSGVDKRRPATFEVVLAPGVDWPSPGSPILDERGWLLGVVANVSAVNGVPVVECEGASLLLDALLKR